MILYNVEAKNNNCIQVAVFSVAYDKALEWAIILQNFEMVDVVESPEKKPLYEISPYQKRHNLSKN